MLATRGGSGPADVTDPVDRESSAVQAVAIFFPVTDLLNLGSSTENPGDGGPPKSFVKAFGPQSTNLAVWKLIGHEVSPIYYVHSNLTATPIRWCRWTSPIGSRLRRKSWATGWSWSFITAEGMGGGV
jgi:hypothetical protein